MSDSPKRSRAYWWIIMLFPIGLAVGTVTSVIHHLRQNQEEEERKQFQVAVTLNAQDIRTSLERAQLLSERHLDTTFGRANLQSARRFIEGTISPGGAGLPFVQRKALSIDERHVYLSYVDIKGQRPEEVVAVVIELPGNNNNGEAAKLSLAPAIIRALTESRPLATLRFILSPQSLSADAHLEQSPELYLNDKEVLRNLLVLKPKEVASAADLNDWAVVGSSTSLSETLANTSGKTALAITHPALYQGNFSPISDTQVVATLGAAEQLRELLLKLANASE